MREHIQRTSIAEVHMLTWASGNMLRKRTRNEFTDERSETQKQTPLRQNKEAATEMFCACPMENHDDSVSRDGNDRKMGNRATN